MLPRSQGNYQVKPPLPFVPGSEVSGVVAEVGPGVKRFKTGDKVWGARHSAQHTLSMCKAHCGNENHFNAHVSRRMFPLSSCCGCPHPLGLAYCLLKQLSMIVLQQKNHCRLGDI